MIYHLAALMVFILSVAGGPTRAMAHALEPGFLELQHVGGETWRVTWRKPQVAGRPMKIDAVLPESCTPRRGPAPSFDGRAFITGWMANCSEGIAGSRIRIDGLERTQTDVLLRYTLAGDTTTKAMRLTAASPASIIPEVPSVLGVFMTYSALGIDHILKGVDHLLFVLLLLLLIRDWRKLIAAVTSFTVAHSLTLAAASLGWIVVPAPPVEAIVALSIVFLASELLHPQGVKKRISERYPWIVAFAFGLLHGLGFARALLEVGLPEGDVPLALLAFNLGVEAGQLLFISVVIALAAAVVRLYPNLANTFSAPASPGLRLLTYGVGTVAALWVIERVAGFTA